MPHKLTSSCFKSPRCFSSYHHHDPGDGDEKEKKKTTLFHCENAVTDCETQSESIKTSTEVLLMLLIILRLVEVQNAKYMQNLKYSQILSKIRIPVKSSVLFLAKEQRLYCSIEHA